MKAWGWVASTVLASAALAGCMAMTSPLGPTGGGNCSPVTMVNLGGPLGFPSSSGAVVIRSQAQWYAFLALPPVVGGFYQVGVPVPLTPVAFANQDLYLYWWTLSNGCPSPNPNRFTLFCAGNPGTLTLEMTVHDPHGPYPEPQPVPTPLPWGMMCPQNYPGTFHLACAIPKTQVDPTMLTVFSYVNP